MESKVNVSYNEDLSRGLWLIQSNVRTVLMNSP